MGLSSDDKNTIRCASPLVEDRKGERPGPAIRSVIRCGSRQLAGFVVLLLLFMHWTGSLARAGESTIRFERVLNTGAEIRGNSVIQDRRGFIWAATQNGLARYDGYGLKWYKKGDEPGTISHNQANALLESRDGMIWVGTFGDGLNRYDPETDIFTRFNGEPGDPASLANDQIWALCESRDGNIWVGTGGGIALFNRKSGTFTNHTHDPDDSGSLGGNTVRALYEDGDGFLWVGTFGAGLSRFDPRSGRFTRFANIPGDPASLSHNDVRSIYEDGDGALWISTIGGGLNRLDRKTGTFTRFMHDPQDPYGIAGNDVRQVLEDGRGRLWVASGRSGVGILDRATGRFTNFSHDPKNPDGIAFDNVYNILEDVSGIIFFFSVGGKIDKYDRNSQQFKLYRNNPADDNSLSTSAVLHIHEDREGMIWFGGFKEGGLTRLDRDTGRYTRYLSDGDDPSALKYSYPTEFMEDSSGRFWVSTSNVSTADLSLFDRETGKVVKRWEHDPADPESLPAGLFFFAMKEDRDDPDVLWIGTYGSGLVKFEIGEERFTRFMKDPEDPQTIGGNIVYDILEDSRGMLWVGTQTGGVGHFDRKSGTFKRHAHDPDDPTSLGKGFVTEVREDSGGEIWVISYGSALNRMDRKTGGFTRYTEAHGFPSSQIQAGPLEDDEGKFWLSTTAGLVRFNPETGRVEKTFTRDDGLQGDAFQYFSGFKFRSGEMWFGGMNGANSFFPEEIRDNPHRPPVYLTRLASGGEEIGTGSALTALESLFLDWRNNFFEFEFAALNFTLPEKNRYRYMLEGLDRKWFDSGTRRFGRYTNIPGGTYTLRIKAANNDGVWCRPDQEVAVRVTVGNPFWKTVWFYLGLGLTAAAGAWFAGVYLLRLRSEIGERKQAETALRRSEEKYRALIENTPDILYRTDLEGKIIFVSPSVERISGYTKEEAIGMKMAQELYVDPRERIVLLEKLREKGVVDSFEARLRRKDGSTWWASTNAHLFRDGEGNVVGVEGVTRDVTARREAEEAVRKAGAILSAIMESRKDVVIFSLDRDLRYTSFNRNHAAEVERRWGAVPVLGEKMPACITDPDIRQQATADYARALGGESFVKEEEAGGGERVVTRELLYNPIEDGEGNVTGLAVLILDITERKALQARVQQAQKMEAIGTLAGGIAHDFNNILSAILGYAELGKEDSTEASRVAEDLDNILEAGMRAKELVKQILAFSRRSDGKSVPLKPISVVRGVVKMLRSTLPATIEIEQDLDDDTPFVTADATRIHQVLMNLCTNAFHAMERTGGRLHIAMKTKTLEDGDLAHEPDVEPGAFVRISVCDSGPGIPPEIRSRIFDPYFTTKEIGRGTGMGLSIAHGIVKSYGGFVTLYSEMGRGSVFHVYLPAGHGEAPPEEGPAPAVSRGSERILLIDDEAPIAGMGKKMLEKLGYRVSAETVGEKALEAFEWDPSAFDLVISDQTMPGMTGAELAGRILEIRPDMPIILCTGYSTVITREEALSTGIREFIMKPFTKREIGELVRKVLDEA